MHGLKKCPNDDVRKKNPLGSVFGHIELSSNNLEAKCIIVAQVRKMPDKGGLSCNIRPDAPHATAGFTKHVPHGRVLGLIDGNLIQKAIATEVECCLPLVFNMGCFSRSEGHLMVCPLPRPRCLLPGPLRDDVGHVPFGRLDHIGGVAIMVF